MTGNRHVRRSEARGPRPVTIARAPSSAHWAILLFGLLALAIQSFVVQTHIHTPKWTGRTQTLGLITLATTGVAADPQSNAPRDKFPINEDPANCPLCKEVTHSGQFVASAAVLAAIPFSVTVNFIVFNEAIPSFFSVSHSWQGRAPPQA